MKNEDVAAESPPAREQPGVVLRRGSSPFPVPHPQSPGDLAFAASGESHQAIRVVGQQRLCEARHRLGSG
jgi:hypothetical protein